jgi:hypothetical protein
MLNVRIEKLQATGIHCANRDCKLDPKYHINIIGSVWYIKVDTTIAVVSMSGKEEIYCRACIDELYQMLRTKLDSKLWAFH